MIEVSGSGVQARTTLITWALPAGYYHIAMRASATNVAVGVPTFRINGWVNAANRFGSAIGYPAGSYETSTFVYLEPGDDIAYETEQESWGMNPDADWEFQLYVHALAEVAQES